jgi:hypothetical protein
MTDPHVESLYYRLETDGTITFENAPPIERETDAFRMLLAEGVVTFEMKEHHASEQSAKARVEPFLRAWEVKEGLRAGTPEIRFRFERPHIVDRAPRAIGSGVKASVTSVTMRAFARLSATALIRKAKYPEPPADFVSSLDVEAMWGRYVGSKAGREPPLSMGYFCLSVLEWSAGGRRQAAQRYRIHLRVLSTLGYLTSALGDRETARKVDQQSQNRALTQQETQWIEVAVRALIQRAGEWAADPTAQHQQLTMSDLPQL